MNIIVPDMLQNALTETMTVDEAADDAAAEDPAADVGHVGRRPPAGLPRRRPPVAAAFRKGSPVSIATAGSAAASSAARRAEIGSLLRRIVDHRHDYLYVLPALLVMLVVIAYPIYYTIELSFFKTPPNLQMRDKVFVGLDNYTARPVEQPVPPGHVADLHLDVRLDAVLLRPRPRRRAGAAPRLRRPRPPARDLPHPLRRQRGRRVLRLEVALPLRLRGDRRAGRPARPDRRADQLHRQHPDRSARR